MKICSCRVENDRRREKKKKKIRVTATNSSGKLRGISSEKGSGARLFKSNRCLNRIREIKTMSAGEFASRSLYFELEANYTRV